MFQNKSKHITEQIQKYYKTNTKNIPKYIRKQSPNYITKKYTNTKIQQIFRKQFQKTNQKQSKTIPNKYYNKKKYNTKTII